jgi:hypothetical protein
MNLVCDYVFEAAVDGASCHKRIGLRITEIARWCRRAQVTR